MFANDTNLFYAERNIEKLFETAKKKELQKTSQWLIFKRIIFECNKY